MVMVKGRVGWRGMEGMRGRERERDGWGQRERERKKERKKQREREKERKKERERNERRREKNEGKREKKREKERKRCPGSIIINLHSILNFQFHDVP